MRVAEVWRYPVKSLQGERVARARLGEQGIDGDRRFALFDLATGYGLTARRLPELLFGSAAALDDGTVRITLPDGSVAADDSDLSDWLGRAVTLRSTSEAVDRQYESADDFEREQDGWHPFDGSSGAFHDSPTTIVSLLSEETIGAWPARRFRANLLLTGGGEDDLVGHRVAVGDAELSVGKQLGRCVMVTRPQPAESGNGTITRDLDVLRTIHRERGGKLAIGATVTVTGTIAVGDELRAL